MTKNSIMEYGKVVLERKIGIKIEI